MLRPEMITQINTILNNAKESVVLYLQYKNLDITYDKFMLGHLKANSATITDLTFELEWLETQRNNNLPLVSSDSMFTQLVNFANIFSFTVTIIDNDTAECVGWNDDEFNYAKQVHSEMFSPIINSVWSKY